MKRRKIYLASPSLFGVASVLLLVSVVLILVGAIFCCWYLTGGVNPAGLFLAGFVTMIALCWAIELVEIPTRWLFWLAKHWGYNGVELLITNKIVDQLEADPEYYQRLARQYSLEFGFHGPWPTGDIYQRILVELGIGIPDKAIRTVINTVLLAGSKVIVHSNQIHLVEKRFHKHCLVEIVDDSPVPPESRVVLDVCHSVCYGNALSEEHLKHYLELWQALVSKWKDPLAEVHFYDCRSGGLSLLRKNLWPLTGQLPLRGVLDSIPHGAVIVLEISPFQLLYGIIRRHFPTRRQFDLDLFR